MLPNDTRGKIITLLKRKHGMSASEIADTLNFHSMTVRQHLSILEREGYVEHRQEKIRRGRPAYVYHFTSNADRLFPSDYSRFAMNLLDTLVVTQGQQKVNQILKRQMEEKFQTYFKDIKNNSLGSKVELLVDFLNEEGYMVEVKETPTAYILEEHNCALESVAQEYRQLCQNELALFQRFLNVPVERQCHMASGDHCCSYVVSKTNHA